MIEGYDYRKGYCCPVFTGVQRYVGKLGSLIATREVDYA
jgi:hypothetical protein